MCIYITIYAYVYMHIHIYVFAYLFQKLLIFDSYLKHNTCSSGKVFEELCKLLNIISNKG